MSLEYSEKKYLELQEKEYKRLEERRKGGRDKSLYEVVYLLDKNQRKNPVKLYQSQAKYDFLQYIRIIMRWACAQSQLGRPDIELLLYLYPIGIFNQYQFNIMCKTIGMYQKKRLQNLIEKGWITIWREYKHKRKILYCLTDKGKRLCLRLHKMSTGEENIPEGKNNPLTKSNKRIDTYYLDVIKRMNNKKES